MLPTDYRKLQEELILGLKEMDLQEDTVVAIVLMLRKEPQILTMMDWIVKHYKESPSEDRVLRIAKLIEEQVS